MIRPVVAITAPPYQHCGCLLTALSFLKHCHCFSSPLAVNRRDFSPPKQVQRSADLPGSRALQPSHASPLINRWLPLASRSSTQAIVATTTSPMLWNACQARHSLPTVLRYTTPSTRMPRHRRSRVPPCRGPSATDSPCCAYRTTMSSVPRPCPLYATMTHLGRRRDLYDVSCDMSSVLLCLGGQGVTRVIPRLMVHLHLTIWSWAL